MTFNIGNQSGGQINNVAGDQHITGGQHAIVVSTADAREAAKILGRRLSRAALSRRDAAAARNEVGEIESGMRAERPDRHRVAAALERLTRLLSAAGALATAGTALLDPIRALAGWLGGMGSAVLQLIG